MNSLTAQSTRFTFSEIFYSGLRFSLVFGIMIAFTFMVSTEVLGADDGSSKKTDKAESKTEKDDDDTKLSTTEHTVNIDGHRVRYRATAGYMVLKNFQPEKKKDAAGKGDGNSGDSDKKDKKETHKKQAKVFFIAYERLDGTDVSKRPVAFSFNGGPGSASVWLHMGALGPQKAVLTSNGEAPPPQIGRAS